MEDLDLTPRALSFGNALREKHKGDTDSEGDEEMATRRDEGKPETVHDGGTCSARQNEGIPPSRRLLRTSAGSGTDEGSVLTEELFSFKMREKVQQAEEEAEECGRSTSPTIWSSRPSSFSESFSGFSRASCHSCFGSEDGHDVVRRTQSAVDHYHAPSSGGSSGGRPRDMSPMPWRLRMGSEPSSTYGSPLQPCSSGGGGYTRGAGRPPSGLPPRTASGNGGPGGGSLSPQRSGSLRSDLLRGGATAFGIPGAAAGTGGPPLTYREGGEVPEALPGIDTVSEQVRAHAVVFARAKGCTIEEAVARLQQRGRGPKPRRCSTGEIPAVHHLRPG